MKIHLKILLSLFAAVFMFSCSEPEDAPTPPEQEETIYYGVIRLADDAMEHFYPAKSRSAYSHAKVSGLRFVTDNKSRSSSDTLIYVINYENNNGFVLLSATNENQPLLAVVPEGNYNPETGSDNPGFNIFMELATAEAQTYDGDTKARLNESPISLFSEADGIEYLGADGKWHKTVRTRQDYIDVEPWTGEEFKWGQTGIYGAYCPNYISGCVPLTIGSIATYMFSVDKTTQYINYDFREKDIDGEILDFTDMFRHKSSEIIDYSTMTITLPHNCTAREETHKSIGRYLRQIGESCNAEYKLATGVTKDAAERELKNYLKPHYVTDFETYNAEDVAYAIDYGLVMILGKGDSIGLHGWFSDGAKYSKYQVIENEAEKAADGGPGNWYIKNTYTQIVNLNYMHWGWHGVDDGWFDGNPFMYKGSIIAEMDYAAVEFIEYPNN